MTRYLLDVNVLIALVDAARVQHDEAHAWFERTGCHAFWPDHISMADNPLIDAALLGRHTQVTDTYLLALAWAHKGQLATLDKRLATEAVHQGKAALVII